MKGSVLLILSVEEVAKISFIHFRENNFRKYLRRTRNIRANIRGNFRAKKQMLTFPSKIFQKASFL